MTGDSLSQKLCQWKYYHLGLLHCIGYCANNINSAFIALFNATFSIYYTKVTLPKNIR